MFDDRRLSRRIAAASEAFVVNLSSSSPPVAAAVVNISGSGARIQTALSIHAGDALVVRLSGLMILAEAVYSTRTDSGTVVGIKLRHSLDDADIERCSVFSACLNSSDVSGATVL